MWLQFAEPSVVATTGAGTTLPPSPLPPFTLRINSSSSIFASLDHKPSLQMPFLLDKRLRCDDHDAVNKDIVDTVSTVTAAGGGFWAIPARPNFGQVWSFVAPPDMAVQKCSRLCFPGDSFSSNPWGRCQRLGLGITSQFAHFLVRCTVIVVWPERKRFALRI
ncbi:hypothetical protein RHSIM_Rhsim07G0144000 [Rhododendron simsii]|uniref:Uncharacterized protein n=1 Tax=Rhododendron simsii TaxID=118357 RepID=A0A834LJT7_RHOSS|nr:hypothetical protein RHSIM_Rhsim07G0144000 [Rhododendron simsii]